MKLQHFAAPIKEAQKLRDLGKALQQPARSATIAEAAKPAPKQSRTPMAATTDDVYSDNMDAAIHTLTQDQKHLHKKLAHHD